MKKKLEKKYRKNGATAEILAHICRRLSKHKEVEIEMVHLADLSIGYCKGCGICYKNGTCILKDDGEELAQKIQKADAARVLKKLIQYSGGILCGSIVINIPFNSSIESNNKLQKKMEHVSEKLYYSVSGRKQYALQQLLHTFIFHIGIKPFVLKKGEAYMGVRKKWETIS